MVKVVTITGLISPASVVRCHTGSNNQTWNNDVFQTAASLESASDSKWKQEGQLWLRKPNTMTGRESFIILRELLDTAH